MHTEFEWVRIALAIGLLTLAFVILPAFFLWKDNRTAVRKAEAARDESEPAR
jgi:uncharacterized iron-regulated membrane protein